MIGGLLCQEVGASAAVLIFPTVGPVGAVALRLAFSAAILLLVARPRLGTIARSTWPTLAAFGLVLAGMNVCFYLALTRLDLGVAVTIEVLGPLVLSVLTRRRWSSLAWATLAFLGVLLLSGTPHAFDLTGALWAGAAAIFWALYILLSQRTGQQLTGLSGLAIALTIGSLAVLPLAAVTAGPALLEPRMLLVGAGIALLSSAIPYAMELLALRRLPAATFSVLLALAPAIAAAAGWVVLGQGLTWAQGAGILAVVAASAGAMGGARGAARAGIEPSAAPGDLPRGTGTLHGARQHPEHAVHVLDGGRPPEGQAQHAARIAFIVAHRQQHV